MPRIRLSDATASTVKKRRLTVAPRRSLLASEANKALCKFQHSSSESIAEWGGCWGGNRLKPGDGVCSSDEPADRLTAPWVISSAGTGGKVCRSAESVHLVLGGVRLSPGRLTDERRDRLPTSSCSPPRLAACRHPDVKRRLISAAVSCYDSSSVNVWTRLFRRRRFTSL